MAKIATLNTLTLNLNDRRYVLKQVQVVKATKGTVVLISEKMMFRLRRQNDGYIHVFDPWNPIGIVPKDEKNPADAPFNLPIFIQQLLNI